MTMPDERSRALVWAGGFMIELARDSNLPLAIRRRAVMIATHFPTVEQLEYLAMLQSSGSEPWLELPIGHRQWVGDLRFGPLRYSTKLKWPEDQ